MLEELNLETLESRRTKHQLTMLHRIVNKLVNIDANKYLKPQKRCLDTRTDQASCLSLLHLIPSSTAFSPRSTSIPLWNNLPASVAEAPSLASFKSGLSSLTF
ncbi:hypothetical protein DPMN_002107 [Dreissena polymorpha]|uniref:Uncharacterized protein n=1 Tax=Dreissena polymorpha TaxID=45954 RepID=A0A9D4RQX1_DREPO|nr:hypothetical protein DPMN_002107 [Dreissena polymorpha]